MLDDTNEDKKIDQEAPKILTLKELLAKKKQNQSQAKGYLGQHNNSMNQSKGTSTKGGAHKPRGHRPQGG